MQSICSSKWLLFLIIIYSLQQLIHCGGGVPGNFLISHSSTHLNHTLFFNIKMDRTDEIAELNSKLDVVLKQQVEITKLIAENNVLLRRNMGLFEASQTVFPIDSKKSLKKLENELKTDKRNDYIAVMKRLLSGEIHNLDRIFGNTIIYSYNYDGVKGKKPLKKYDNILNALYESTKTEGQTYRAFIKEFRLAIHRFKNNINRANARKVDKKIRQSLKNIENEENKENVENNEIN